MHDRNHGDAQETGSQVCTAPPDRRECVTLAIETGGQVNGYVFNLTANYYRSEHPISSIINTHNTVAKFINTE